jgi:predicted Zn-dependent protease
MQQSERIKSLKALLDKEPNDSFLNYAMALEMHKLGEIKRSAELMEELLFRDENYLGAYLQLGQIYEELGEKDKALEAYTKGIQIAKQQKNTKTLSELNQAILVLED